MYCCFSVRKIHQISYLLALLVLFFLSGCSTNPPEIPQGDAVMRQPFYSPEMERSRVYQQQQRQQQQMYRQQRNSYYYVPPVSSGYNQYPPSSRSYSNPYAFVPQSPPYYDGDQYYVPPTQFGTDDNSQVPNYNNRF